MALAFVIRDFHRRWCEVLCTYSYQKRVDSLRVGSRPQSPHESAAESSLLEAFRELRRLEVVSRGHRDYRRGCGLLGCSGVGERAGVRKSTLGLLCWGLGIRFDQGVPPRTTVLSLQRETICLVDGSP